MIDAAVAMDRPSRRSRGRRGLAVVGGAIALAVLAAVLLARPLAARRARDVLEAGAARTATALRADARRAQASAVRIASRPDVQAAIAKDGARLDRLGAPAGVAVYRGGRLVAGTAPRPGLRRTVGLTADAGVVARVVVTVPLDGTGLRLLRRRARLPSSVVVFFARNGRIEEGSLPRAHIPVGTAGPAAISLGGRTYLTRQIALPGSAAARVGLALPEAWIADRAASTRRRALLLGAAAAATLAAAWSSLWTLRGAGRPRRRVRKSPEQAIALLGNALAASHDPISLLPVILRVAVDATGARGGRLLEGGAERARVGNCSPSRHELVLPLEEAQGDYRLVLYPASRSVDRRGQESARWLAAQAASAIENARLHDVIKRQAATDDLTGLLNRRQFRVSLAAELSRVDRFGGSVALLLADLDDFKQINDTFGHDAGDAVLAEFASLLTGELREVDVAARLGGEEFSVLLPETSLEDATTVAERLRSRTAGRRFVLEDGRAIGFTVSIGVTAGAAGDPRELLRDADRALYRAKALGKNRVAQAEIGRPA